jgi:WD40 repeat protein/serine/threonine protein kinase
MVSASPAGQGARVREIFAAALEKSNGPERAAFLDVACAKDAALRENVEQLLREHDRVGNFLEAPAMSSAGKWTPTQIIPPPGEALASGMEKPGDRIGRYKLLQKIGEGGCGIVYMAEQEEPVRRRVALKIIKLGMDTRNVIARFEAERQALAMMDHPNIARVFDAGATESGRPFFVMELVRGVRVTEYADENNLPTEDRLKLFVQVCHAIQHAHQKGVIHRDIKPSNILVTLHDGIPVPKVIDFGIAKATEQRLTEKTLFTEFTAFIGTPAYMSPEQAEMSGLDIDTRSDIYSLGVLLYELLIGKTPFDAEALMKAGLDECRRTIRQVEPARPSTRLATMLVEELTTTARQRHTEGPRLVHLLRGELDWIALKCLEKDRTRRYATAQDLAADVQRYLEKEPVFARPPSNVYRLRKLLQRHQGAFAAAAVVAVSLIAGVTISIWQAIRATDAEHHAQSARDREIGLRRQAEQQKGAAQLNEYVADINLAQESLKDGNYGRAVQLLSKHEPKTGEADLRGFEWRYLWQQSRGDEHLTFPTQDGSVQAIAFSRTGDLLAIAQRDKVNVWNPHTRTLLKTLPRSNVVSAVFFPDGQRLVTASQHSVRVLRTSDWTEERTLGLGEDVGPIALSADGLRLAANASRQFRDHVRIWDTTNWRLVRGIPGESGPVAFSPDGKFLITDARAGLTLWPVETSGSGIVLEDSTNVFVRTPWASFNKLLAFSPDGKAVVAARNLLSDKGVFVITVWDTATGKEIATMPSDPEHIEHTGVIAALDFSPDGRTLASASFDHSIRFWDFAARQPTVTLQGHLTEVWALAFTPDGKSLWSAGKDGGVKIWALDRHQKEDAIAGTWEPLGFSNDGNSVIAFNHRESSVATFNVTTLKLQQEFKIESPRFRLPGQSLAFFSPGSQSIIYGTEGGFIKSRRIHSEEANSTKLPLRRNEAMLSAVSPDGNMVFTRGWDQTLYWWDLQRGGEAKKIEGHRVLFSPDGQTMAVLQRSNTVAVWDVPSRTVRKTMLMESGLGSAAAFSPDSRILAMGAGKEDIENAVRLLDVRTGEVIGSCVGHKQGVSSICFSPDGRTLASSSDDSTVRLWNVATQQELLTIRRLGGTLRNLLFSPDGEVLVGASGSSRQAESLRFFRAPRLKESDLAEAVGQQSRATGALASLDPDSGIR